LIVTRTKHPMIGHRAFPVAAARAWNSLSPTVDRLFYVINVTTNFQEAFENRVVHTIIYCMTDIIMYFGT